MDKHLCPCCSQPLLRHISFKRIYWFCSQCHQEMPDLQTIAKKSDLGTHYQNCPPIKKRKEWEKNLCCIESSNLSQDITGLDTDRLTGIANLLQFQLHLEEEWRHLAWEQAPLSLILADIDCFKLYNERYGEQAGDQCLQQVAQAIARTLNSPVDLVARFGGEEFAIILPNTKAEGAMQVAEDIRASVKALKIVQDTPLNQCLTLSLGVVSLVPLPDYAAGLLITVAQQALSQAKARGRDCIVLYESLLRQTSLGNEQVPLVQESQRDTPTSIREQSKPLAPQMELLMSYVAYHVSQGKSVISPLSGPLTFKGSVYKYWGYHRDFQNFWRHLTLRYDFPNLYLEGDFHCFEQFLSGYCLLKVQ